VLYSKAANIKLSILLSICIATIVAGVFISIRRPSAAVLEFNGPKLAEQLEYRYNHLIVVGRRKERTSLEDAEIPFRNSRIAVYRKTDQNVWEKVSPDIPTRSTSTAIKPPEDENEESLAFLNGDRGGYGYRSVPIGLYSLKPTLWRDGENWSFIVSEWGGDHGKIFLDDTQKIFLNSGELAKETRIKRNCYLHISKTKYWSHGDSLGCINLHKPEDSPANETKSDWGRFLNYLNRHNIFTQEKILAGLLLMDDEELYTDGGSLVDKLKITFKKDGMKIRAELL
jgi:hypothetical protein